MDMKVTERDFNTPLPTMDWSITQKINKKILDLKYPFTKWT